jgi:hypothetical protein
MSTIAELVDIVVTQCTDMIQAIDLEQNKYNYGSVELSSGETPISFAEEYIPGENWHFLIKEAIDTGGYDIGCTVSNRTNTGFNVTVNDACTFTYETVFRKSWISD